MSPRSRAVPLSPSSSAAAMVHDDVYLCLYVCSAAGSEAPQKRGSYDGQANYSNSTYTCPSLSPRSRGGRGACQFWIFCFGGRQIESVKHKKYKVLPLFWRESGVIHHPLQVPRCTTQSKAASKNKQDQAQITNQQLYRSIGIGNTLSMP